MRNIYPIYAQCMRNQIQTKNNYVCANVCAITFMYNAQLYDTYYNCAYNCALIAHTIAHNY
jgi:hypothetical protein